MQWDIFCKVIDNYGDVGVCWRLSTQLGTLGHRVRLWIDDARALAWMAPNGHPNVTVFTGEAMFSRAHLHTHQAPDVVVEAFGCEIDATYLTQLMAWQSVQPRVQWVNLEYLSAESYVERCHRLPSPVGTGPAAGMTKTFFYPGFNDRTGGLLKEPDLAQRQATFNRDAWLMSLGINRHAQEKLVSLFCYEPAALAPLLQAWSNADRQLRLLVTHGRAAQAVAHCIGEPLRQPGTSIQRGALTLHQLPALSQMDYDHLLWACDLNFVRGEDSLVRAMASGRPFVWQIYPQDDGAHLNKLQAFLDAMDAPGSMRRWHQNWNAITCATSAVEQAVPLLDDPLWHEQSQVVKNTYFASRGLLDRLLEFIEQKTDKIEGLADL